VAGGIASAAAGRQRRTEFAVEAEGRRLPRPEVSVSLFMTTAGRSGMNEPIKVFWQPH